MPPKVKGTESKRGLVVTMVFMVLLIIGEGLGAYYGFAEQEKLKTAAKASKDVSETATKERDWYRFQIAILLAYLDKPVDANSPIGRELTAARKADFDQDKYPDDKLKAIDSVKQELPVLKALVGTLNQRSAWDNARSAPAKTLKEVIEARDVDIADLKRQRDKAEQTRLGYLKEKEKSEASLAQARIDYDARVEKVKNDFKKEREDLAAANDKLKEQVEAIAKTKDDTVTKPLEKERDDARKDVARLTNEIKGLNDRIATLVVKVPVATAAAEDKHHDPTPRGKVLRVNTTNSRKLIIDLGRVQGLTAQTTFSIHGYQPNGKPKLRSKANIEIVNVGELTSDALVTAVFHPDDREGERRKIDVLSRDNTDPIISGDALINPLWNPNAKTHVAIAGLIDLTGAGPVSLPAFIQLLEKQNIVVDAYVDPVDGSIRGRGLTKGTEYLILGNKSAGKDGDPINKAMDASIEKLIKDATENGIPKMAPRRFMNETGFHMPRTINE